MGKTAYGCSNWKTGCDYLILFKNIELEFQTRRLNKKIINFFAQKIEKVT